MDVLGIFDGSKPLKKVTVPVKSHRLLNRPTDMSALDNQLNETRSSILTQSGTEYVEEYVKEEEERMLAEASPLSGIQGKAGESVEALSLMTAPPAHHDLENEELTQIYKTYNFDYRPKENLTITSLESKIVTMIETNMVTVIQGPTGCGKTTQVPQFILDSCKKKRVHCNIIVTQPRRIAAISIAKRVSHERTWPLGSLVGFQVGMVNNTSKDTRLTYCTTGVLLQKLITTKNMLDYTHVIIDEVHERDQDMDFLLLVVRKLQRSNSRSVKIVLMSATFNVNKFATYFSTPVGNKLSPAPVVDITKTNFFKVQVHYLCHITTLGKLPEVVIDEPKVTSAMMDFCVRILYTFDTIDRNTNHRYGVLIFLPGIWEIEEMHTLLTNEKNEPLEWDVVVLHSTITNEEQQRIFEQPPRNHRRIILATNIAESSITVPDIKYVVDFCLTKQLIIDSKTNFQCLELGWASKANCEQRAGRAGRLMDGRVYRLVPERFYENFMLSEGTPEMLRAPLENVVLKAKILDMGEPKALLALSLDPPNLSYLESTILSLKETGALLNKDDQEISEFDGDLTDLGRIMAHLPLDIRISKLITLGHVFSVLREATIIGASMAVKNMFSAPFQKKLQAFTAKLAWADYSNSDCISFLNVYNTWMHDKANRNLRNDNTEKQWARKKFLQIKVLREIEALVHDLTTRLRRLGITETLGPNRVIWKDDERPLVIKIVIAGGFYPNYYTKSVNNGGIDGVKILGGLDPTKTVYLQGWPINQPGPLYARRIQKCFQDCVNTKVAKVLVSFDNSSRVYVQFRKNESQEEDLFESTDEPGEISLSVFKAIKLRDVNDAFEIPLLYPDVAHQKARELNLKLTNCQILIPKEESEDQVQRPDLSLRPILPGLDDSHIPIIIRRIVTPGHFWAQLKDEENDARLQLIQTTINAPNYLLELTKRPEIGSLIIAPRSQKDKIMYCRAIVQNISIATKSEFLAKVIFIDYGYVDRVRVFDLRELPKNDKIGQIPALAFECVLAEIRPSVMTNLSGQWSHEATEKFHKLLAGDVSIFGEVYSVVNSVVYLKLVRVQGTEEIEINQHFIELGYAERKEENYLSRCNHEIRKTALNMPQKQRRHHEELQYEQSFVSDSYPEAPDEEDCSSTASLRGPYSPLEIALSSVTKAGVGKRVHIDNSSVNSVLLDVNPEDPHDRLLIAGSVSQNASGHCLTLRNTTLMPNIPGLTSLICLMFTPQMELRRNVSATRYNGALCGLGYHPETKCSLFPEHDLSIYFDVDITMDDLQDINRLRHWMSMGIFVNPDGVTNDDAGQIAFCQNRVKDVFFELLEKRRDPITREWDTNFGRWCRYDERLIIPPGKVVTMKQNIFRLHNALDLKEKDDERERMISHIMDLRELSTRNRRDEAVAAVICNLCNVNIYGLWQLRIHLNTTDHKKKEQPYHPLPNINA